MLRIAATLRRAIVRGPGSSQFDFLETIEGPLQAGPARLDIGCGRALVPGWLSNHESARHLRAARNARFTAGLDVDRASLRDNPMEGKVQADVRRLPFASGSFDLVTANMVVEHLAEPEACLDEIRRVLKPSGLFVFHTPNLRSPLINFGSRLPEQVKRVLVRTIEGRRDEDIFPAAYRLNTTNRIREAAAGCGLIVKAVKLVWSAPATQILGPLAVFELVTMRLFGGTAFAQFRPDIVAVLEKPRALRVGRPAPAAVPESSETPVVA